MTYTGSCHCGRIAYEVDGEIDQVIECNCSICRKRGYLLWFVPRGALRLATPAAELAAYTFGPRTIVHHFCPSCGCAPFGFGEHPRSGPMAAINVRCLDGVEPAALTIVPFDGRAQ